MSISLSSDLLTKKNELAQSGAWLLLLEFNITGIKELAYDGQTENFLLGDKVTGGTSGAYAWIVGDTDAGATGTLEVYDIRGTFQNNETLTGKDQGTATTNIPSGVQDADVTYRFVRNTEGITWNSNAYTASSFTVDALQQDVQGRMQELTIHLANTDSGFHAYVNKCFGLPFEAVKLTLIHSEYVSGSDKVFEEEYQILACSVSMEWISFSLGSEPRLLHLFPRGRYEWRPCRYQFKGIYTCQYSGGTTTCSRRLEAGNSNDCIDQSNEEHFGAFPSIPGGQF